jgi:hypothetical protein
VRLTSRRVSGGRGSIGVAGLAAALLCLFAGLVPAAAGAAVSGSISGTGSGETSGIDAELVPTGAIEGTVTATEDGLPAAEIEVCAYGVVSEEIAGCDFTAADGSYSIGLEGGAYKISFWSGPSGRALALQFYDHESRWVEADVLAVAEGETKTGVDADLAPGATISGHVSSAATGLPLEEIHVCSIDALSGGLWTCTWTNSKGNYALRRFSAGVYKMVFSLELKEWFGGEAPGGEDDGFPTQFWNNQTTLSAANPISLTTGGIAQGVDARLGGPAAAVPRAVPPAVTPAVRRHRKCRPGFRRKLAHGKRRCLRAHRRHRKRHRHEGGTGARRSELLAIRSLGR